MSRSLQTLELLVPEEANASPTARPEIGRAQLWLAVCLPNLALEAIDAGTSEPSVVVELDRGQLYVVAVSASARKVGIEIGYNLTAALALSASLRASERLPGQEQACLESLASWAEQLTSLLGIVPLEGLVLEVAGSLKLFRSLDAIKAKLGAELDRRGLKFKLCAAPTPTAALWLARAGQSDVLAHSELNVRLSSLPVVVTRWPPVAQALLRELGLRTVGECARLPRDGFARRVGPLYLRELDRAYGRQFDLPEEFKAPQKWSSRVDVLPESADSALLLEAAEAMLDELVFELRKRQAQIMSLQIEFAHSRHESTFERFDLREPVHDRERLWFLVKDRLERKALPLPASALGIESGFFLPLEHREADLFDEAPVESTTEVLLERLKERFGSEAVYGLRAIAEHRPERAWVKFPSPGSCRCIEASVAEATRPLWLLPNPVPLSSHFARRHYRGSIALCSGLERIESGWWDEQDIGRDYYRAVSSNGEKLWIYKDRRSRSWHLHGLFG
jgi:protein ImuB